MKKNKDLQTFYDQVYKKGEKKHYTKILFTKNTLPIEETEVLGAVSWKRKTVLDVGCGTGLLGHEIARRGAKKVVGLDFSEEAIHQAQQLHQHPRLSYVCEDIKKHKQTYDIIVSLGTLEHMDNPLATLRAMKRLLAPGGKLVLSCPNWTNPRGYVLQTLRILLDAPITLADLHYLTPIEFQAWSKKLGMKLTWKTFDRDWSHGERLLKDFERRLPNVLNRDMKLNIPDARFTLFLKWIKEHVVALDHTAPYSGALGLYIFSLK